MRDGERRLQGIDVRAVEVAARDGPLDVLGPQADVQRDLGLVLQTVRVTVLAARLERRGDVHGRLVPRDRAPPVEERDVVVQGRAALVREEARRERPRDALHQSARLNKIPPLVLGYPKNSSKFSTAVKSNSFLTILGPSVFALRVLDDWRENPPKIRSGTLTLNIS